MPFLHRAGRVFVIILLMSGLSSWFGYVLLLVDYYNPDKGKPFGPYYQ
jgi:hypothetical protein